MTVFPYYRAKHPVKVHVWAGISMRGRTGICIFEGIMDVEILQQTLLPFISEVYPDGHRFMQVLHFTFRVYYFNCTIQTCVPSG